MNSKMQHAGGMLLPPVQTLVATIIFANGKNANKSGREAMGALPDGRESDLSALQRSTDEEGAPSPTKMSGTATGQKRIFLRYK